eukprot:gb/GECH01007589.1/.p1 GENE.gb/GECH01007589.1/~~gb/GECH01007589.1/.p1  ORF type:complete len:223 (+),score=6.63 gb/GECH01007589.1/:1-669(+)
MNINLKKRRQKLLLLWPLFNLRHCFSNVMNEISYHCLSFESERPLLPSEFKNKYLALIHYYQNSFPLEYCKYFWALLKHISTNETSEYYYHPALILLSQKVRYRFKSLVRTSNKFIASMKSSGPLADQYIQVLAKHRPQRFSEIQVSEKSNINHFTWNSEKAVKMIERDFPLIFSLINGIYDNFHLSVETPIQSISFLELLSIHNAVHMACTAMHSQVSSLI